MIKLLSNEGLTDAQLSRLAFLATVWIKDMDISQENRALIFLNDYSHMMTFITAFLEHGGLQTLFKSIQSTLRGRVDPHVELELAILLGNIYDSRK